MELHLKEKRRSQQKRRLVSDRTNHSKFNIDIIYYSQTLFILRTINLKNIHKSQKMDCITWIFHYDAQMQWIAFLGNKVKRSLIVTTFILNGHLLPFWVIFYDYNIPIMKAAF